MTEVLRASVAPSPVTGAAVGVVDGRSAVFALLPELEDLGRSAATPLTARSAWLRAELVADAAVRPWAVTVRSGGGDLRGVAVLLPRDGVHVLGAGGDGYLGGVPVADHAAAVVLGEALAAEADRRGAALQLGTMPDDDAVRELAEALGADRLAGAPVPALMVGQDRELAAYLSHGTSRTLRKARNRLAADQRDADIRVTRRPADVTAALPSLQRAFRSRDLEHGLDCPLDSPLGLARWRERIRQLLAARYLELVTLTIDGELAAYVLGVRDGGVYGVLEGHFDTAWARYSPGRVLEAAVVAGALADPGVHVVDWMTSAAPETLLAATCSRPVTTLMRRAGARRAAARAASVAR